MSLTLLIDGLCRACRRAAPSAYTLRVTRRDDAAAMQRFVDVLTPQLTSSSTAAAVIGHSTVGPA
jgi:hypothetical protein